jgi:hypothetical protein
MGMSGAAVLIAVTGAALEIVSAKMSRISLAVSVAATALVATMRSGASVRAGVWYLAQAIAISERAIKEKDNQR